VIELSYFICVLLLGRPIYWYQHFWPFYLEVWPTLKKLYIYNIFWMIRDPAFIFCMCVFNDNAFLLVPTFLPYDLDLEVWSFFKNFNIGHIFWMVSDMALVCVLLMRRLFYWYHSFWSCDLHLEVWPFLKKKTLNIGHIFWLVSDRDFAFHMRFPCDRTILLQPWILIS
jgi:hypothetical protein